MKSVFKATKINHCEFDIKLVTKWVINDGSSTIDVEDDRDTDAMFSVGIKVIKLYIKKSKLYMSKSQNIQWQNQY